MADPDKKTILIDIAHEGITNNYINLQKYINTYNLYVKSLLKLIMNEWSGKEEQKNLDSGELATI